MHGEFFLLANVFFVLFIQQAVEFAAFIEPDLFPTISALFESLIQFFYEFLDNWLDKCHVFGIFSHKLRKWRNSDHNFALFTRSFFVRPAVDVQVQKWHVLVFLHEQV